MSVHAQNGHTMEQRLTRRDFYFILACLTITALCLEVGIQYFHRAFLEASIDYLLRNNILAYMLTAFAAQSLSGSLHLLEQSAALYQTNGWLWLGAGILCLLALILQTRHQNQTS